MIRPTENKDKIILHLCADTGSDTIPYQKAGYDVRLVGSKIGVENFNPPPNVYGIIANPPCTMFSMARSMKAISPRDLREGMKLVKECLRIIWECQYACVTNGISKSPLKFWALENPGSGYLKWFLGNPVFQYCQSEYGASFTKSTALWGMFNAPKRPLLYAQLPSKSSLAKQSGNSTPRGMEKRSQCPIDFAKCFFEANP